jgi:two-component system chemotaxis response regulator CheY
MMTILLVDDEPISLRVMRLSLENDGYQVTTAFDGQDALEKITANRPDILITDIDMPRMTGKDLCLHLQDAMPDRLFPIFVSTSLTALEHRDWSGRISNLFLLEKPISLRKLRAAIRELTAGAEIAADGSNL